MKQRFLLFMMTVLLSVGAWAESLWTGSETLAYYGFKLTDAVSMSAGDVLTFTVSETTKEWAGIKLKTNDMTQGYATPGTELISTSAAVGTVKIVVTSEVAAAATADGLWLDGNDCTVTSVDLEQKQATLNLYSNEEGTTVNYWGSGLSKAMFGAVQTGDLLTVTIKSVGENWGANLSVTTLAGGDGNVELATASISPDELPTTVQITFTDDMVAAAKSNGLYLNGGIYTYTAVDLVYASSGNDTPTVPDTDGDYTITINESDNGSVTADHTNANEGETITLTVTPASDSFKMVKLTIEQTTSDEGDDTPVLLAPRRTPGFASNVEYEKVDDTHYTFVMPANDVEISAVFSDNPVARPTITYDAPNNKVTLSLTKNPTGEDAGFASNDKVYYTTDGTDPTTSATKQESDEDVEITVTKDITIIRVVGVSSTGHTSVEVYQAVSLVRYLTVSKEWTVFCSPETFSVPEGLKAYTISAVTQPDNADEAGSVTLKEQTLIAENVPMVIQNTQIESSTEKFQIQEAEGEIAGADMCANFKGSATAASTLSSSNRNYVLKNGEFIRTTATKVSQYNCYLEFSTASASPAPRYSITIDGNTTSVKTIGVATLDEGDWYTLSGMRMQQPGNKGIYIHNGKKVVIK